MTKQQERDCLSAFIASLPADSYLRPMLTEVQPDMVSAIANDFAFIDFRARVEEQRDHRHAVADLTAQRDALQLEVRQLERQAERLREGIAQLQREARRLAGV